MADRDPNAEARQLLRDLLPKAIEVIRRVAETSKDERLRRQAAALLEQAEAAQMRRLLAAAKRVHELIPDTEPDPDGAA